MKKNSLKRFGNRACLTVFVVGLCGSMFLAACSGTGSSDDSPPLSEEDRGNFDDFGLNWQAEGIDEIIIDSGGQWMALSQNFKKDGNYIVHLNKTFDALGGGTIGSAEINIKVSLRGTGKITLISGGSAHLLSLNNGDTTILRGPTLVGKETNSTHLVDVSGAETTFIIRDGKIISNKSDEECGGIFIDSSSSLVEMYGGEISGNKGKFAGAVLVKRGTFIMRGGYIINNETIQTSVVANEDMNSGGVYINSGAKFTKIGGGTIKDNKNNIGAGHPGGGAGKNIFYKINSSIFYYRDLDVGPQDNISTDPVEGLNGIF